VLAVLTVQTPFCKDRILTKDSVSYFHPSVSSLKLLKAFRLYFILRINGATVAQSVWLQAERQRGRDLSAVRVTNFHFSISSRPALGPIQPPIYWEPVALSSGVKQQERRADL
jgi:hypothetical protein